MNNIDWKEYEMMMEQWENESPWTSQQLTEIDQLVSEMKPLNFRKSYQVSNYIVRNKLGYKYPNIAGVITMRKDGDEWDFKGGIDPDVYAEVCNRLGLFSMRSRSRPVKYVSYRNNGNSF